MSMTVTREEEKPWKTDLARKAAQRREQVGLELDELIKKAASFEDALRQAVELMKARFARYSSVTLVAGTLPARFSLRRAALPARSRR